MEDKKTYVKRVLTHIQAVNDKVLSLNRLGLDISDDNELSSTELYEEAISYAIAGEYGDGLVDMVSWWLYEDVKKIITVDGVEYNITDMDDFIDWLFETFGE